MEKTENNIIDLLRHALAAIWTELDKDKPSEEDMERIAYEALHITRNYAGPKDLTLGETGLAAWEEYCEKHEFSKPVPNA